LFDSQTSASACKQLGGNGGLPFYQQTNASDGKVFTKVTGVTQAGIQRDGTSNTIMFAESREEVYTSWISGLASYVVAFNPEQNPAATVTKPAAIAPAVATLQVSVTTAKSALNVGSNVKRLGSAATDADYYMKNYPHKSTLGGNTAWRTYGPSSAHTGVVLHGFGDGHGEQVKEDVDVVPYMHMVTRNGSEVINKPGG
jgi:hypothetical protein